MRTSLALARAMSIALVATLSSQVAINAAVVPTQEKGDLAGRSLISDIASAVAHGLNGHPVPSLDPSQLVAAAERLVPAGAFSLNRTGNGSRQQASDGSNEGVRNALGPGQDPSPISRIEGDGKRHYYFATSDNNRGVYMQASTDLNSVLSVSSNEVKVYTYDTLVQPQAPGLFQYDSNTYVMYLSSLGPNANGTLRALTNNGQNLTSEWQDEGELRQPSTGKKLVYYDAFPFNHPNGRRYLLFSGNKYVAIAQLISPTTIGNTILTIHQGSGQTVEAPGAHVQGTTLNVFWSENEYNGTDYNIINTHASITSDPLSADTWKSAPKTTILSSGNQVYGTGSGTTFAGPDGQPWMAYTCFYNPNGFPSDKTNPRRIQAQPAIFNGDTLGKIEPDTPTEFVDKDGY